MSKTIPGKLGLIILTGLVLTVLLSGCVENKVSAAKEINTSYSLIQNAELKLKSGIRFWLRGLHQLKGRT
jgi:outer membrane lipoprotein-sorting protein